MRHTALVALITLLWASAAWGNPVNVFFDGPGNEGMSEEDALASGLQILTGDTFAAEGVIDVTGQSLDGVDITGQPQVNPYAETSTWTIENLLGTSVLGTTYLLFATASDHDSFPTSYDPAEVGLTVDADDGWAIVQGESGGQTVYYVGISLGNLLETVGSSTTIDVNYYLLEAFPMNVFPDPDDPDFPNCIEDPNLVCDEILALPKLHLLVAFNVVPEPGTGLLLAMGLVGLGVTRRRGPH